MQKEEMLEKSRNDNNGMDEMEYAVLATAGKIASQIGMLVCSIVAVLQVIFTDTISFEGWMIYFSILSATFSVKYIKLHRRHELVWAIVYGVLFIFFTVMFIRRLIG